MRTRLLVAAALVVVAAGAFYWSRSHEIAVEVARPQSNVEVRVFGIGTVEAQVVSRVGFQIAGKLDTLRADQGGFVKAGALLATLDEASQRARVAKSEVGLTANLARIHAQRNRADVLYQQKKSVNARRQALVGRGAVSQEAAEDTQAAEDIAQSELKLVEADLAVANVLQADAAAQHRIEAVLLEQHELRSPFDARIIARHKELGSVVNAGEAVFTLIEPHSVWIRAYIDESSAGGLEIGQTAFVRLRSEPGSVVEAEVVRIDQENDRVTEERRVYVRCRNCGPQHQFRYLGEQAEIEIVKKVVPEGLFIPLKIVEAYDGRSGMIWLLERGRLTRGALQLGDRLLDGRVQVLSKLPADSAIVLESGTRLREGRAAHAITTQGS